MSPPKSWACHVAAASRHTATLVGVPGAFLRAREKDSPIPGETEFLKGAAHPASGSSTCGRWAKPKNEPEWAVAGMAKHVVVITGVKHVCNKATQKAFPSKEACEYVTEEELGRRVSLAENRSLTETIKNQGLGRGSRRREPGTQSTPGIRAQEALTSKPHLWGPWVA